MFLQLAGGEEREARGFQKKLLLYQKIFLKVKLLMQMLLIGSLARKLSQMPKKIVSLVFPRKKAK